MRGEEVVGSAVCWAVLLLMLVAYLVVVADHSCCSDYWLGILLRFHKGNLLCLYLYVSTYVYSRVGVCLFRLLFLCLCLFLSHSFFVFFCPLFPVCLQHICFSVAVPVSWRASERAGVPAWCGERGLGVRSRYRV